MDKKDSMSYISEYVSWESECREKAVLEMLQLINDICDEFDIQYFAIGNLLEKALSGEVLDSSRDYLEILLLRHDYDRFIDYISTTALRKDKTLSFDGAYNKSGTIKRRTAVLHRKRTFRNGNERLTVSCSIRLIPMDILPNDAAERSEFIDQVVDETKDYLQKSARLNSIRSRKTGKSLIKKIANRGRAFIFRGGFHNKYIEKKDEYHNLLTSYSDTENPQYIGRIELFKGLEVTYDQVFPRILMYIKGTPVYFPHDIEYFNTHFGNIDYRKLLAERVELLKAFDEYCLENGIEYSLGWDISISVVSGSEMDERAVCREWDICLLRNDYDKLVKSIQNGNSQLKIIDTEKDMPKSACLYRKLAFSASRKDSKLITDYPLRLIPFDYLPDNYKEGSDLCVAAVAAAKRLKSVIAYEKGQKFVRLHPFEDSKSDFRKLHEICSSCSSPTKRVFTIYQGKVFAEDVKELFPSQRCNFNGFSVSVPANKYCWHYKTDPDFVECISEKKTAVLEKLDKLCIDNGIRYFAISSLLIGATVYHDVIPDGTDYKWDIALVRDDYQRLLMVMEEKGDQYGIALVTHYDEEKEIPLSKKRVVDSKNPIKDVFVRLVPFDKVPLDFYLGMGLENMLQEKNDFYKQLILAKRFPYRDITIPFKGQKLQKCKSYLETAVPNAEYEAIDSLAQSFNDTDRPYIYRGIRFSKTRRILEKDLFPLKREIFRGIQINCPKDTSPWQPVINDELNRQVNCIQRAAIVLLKEFDKACSELGLGYFICGGTMLGYVRHGGFIPWDDDIDVAMLREDYEKFISQAASVLPENIFLQTRETDKMIPYLFSKLRLKDTEYVTEYSMVREYHQGICLDIFPFDYLPNEPAARTQFLKKIKTLSKTHYAVAKNQLSPPEEKPVPENEIERKCLEFEEKMLASSWDTDLAKTQADYLAVATRYNKNAKRDKLTTVASFVPSYTYIDLDDLLPYQRGLFQGIEVSVPKRPDVFLEMQYGDYMKMPPVHNRIAHRLIRWRTWEGSGGTATDNDSDKDE